MIDLLVNGFDPALRPFHITGCSGFARYVLDQLAAQQSEIHFCVLLRGAAVSGMAELRASQNGLHLNHIYVAPEFQGSGVGARLLLESLRLVRTTQQEFTLDVFSTNTRAVGWYDRLGLKGRGRQYWLLLPDSHAAQLDTARPEWTAVHSAAAEAQHARYGFSMERFENGTDWCLVGRLGRNLFRVSTSALVQSHTLLPVLRIHAPERRILAIGAQFPGAHTLAISIQFAGHVEAVMRRLDR